MKLVTKFILIYLIVTFVVLSAGGVIGYHIIRNSVANELRWQLIDQVERIEEVLEDERNIDRYQSWSEGGRNFTVQRLRDRAEKEIVVSDTLVWHENLERMEQNVKVSSNVRIRGRYYNISAYGVLIDSDDVIESILQTLLWIFGLQVLGAIGIGLLVSGRLFRPFKETLVRIKNFKLQSSEPIRAEETGVEEFNDMNRFVEEMTEKVVSDYQNLKEFAENASHELQTPLSIVGGKLDLLLESDLNEEQYKYVESAHRAINKLSRLSKSLSMLTKIENHEFNNDEEVSLSNVIKESLIVFDELIKLNDLTIESEIEEDVFVKLHPVMADLMWTNLLQNAIKHNKPGGFIKIYLSARELNISNAGQPLESDPDELFQRFKKDDTSSDSIGLGLAIVKHITDMANFTVHYEYEEGAHTVIVRFVDPSIIIIN